MTLHANSGTQIENLMSLATITTKNIDFDLLAFLDNVVEVAKQSCHPPSRVYMLSLFHVKVSPAIRFDGTSEGASISTDRIIKLSQHASTSKVELRTTSASSSIVTVHDSSLPYLPGKFFELTQSPAMSQSPTTRNNSLSQKETWIYCPLSIIEAKRRNQYIE